MLENCVSDIWGSGAVCDAEVISSPRVSDENSSVQQSRHLMPSSLQGSSHWQGGFYFNNHSNKRLYVHCSTALSEGHQRKCCYSLLMLSHKHLHLLPSLRRFQLLATVSTELRKSKSKVPQQDQSCDYFDLVLCSEMHHPSETSQAETWTSEIRHLLKNLQGTVSTPFCV